jgi:hypothetical protein
MALTAMVTWYIQCCVSHMLDKTVSKCFYRLHTRAEECSGLKFPVFRQVKTHTQDILTHHIYIYICPMSPSQQFLSNLMHCTQQLCHHWKQVQKSCVVNLASRVWDYSWFKMSVYALVSSPVRPLKWNVCLMFFPDTYWKDSAFANQWEFCSLFWFFLSLLLWLLIPYLSGFISFELGLLFFGLY